MRLYSALPSFDLHGIDTVYAKILVRDFIEDQVWMKNRKCIIIHGIGTGKVRKAVGEALKQNSHVKTYKIDNFNPGCTLVELK